MPATHQNRPCPADRFGPTGILGRGPGTLMTTPVARAQRRIDSAASNQFSEWRRPAIIFIATTKRAIPVSTAHQGMFREAAIHIPQQTPVIIAT
jgi:hypothetical protein